MMLSRCFITQSRLLRLSATLVTMADVRNCLAATFSAHVDPWILADMTAQKTSV